MISIGKIDQRERKKRQGQAAAFYSSPSREQMQCVQSRGQQMPACGVLG